MADLRDAIREQVRLLFGTTDDNQIDLTRPPGDPGFLPVDSVAWRVHGDLTAMLAGGIASLLMQMLHPAALAGVWDHSGFRRDMQGRLRRTAQFVSATTYGSSETAAAMIARVRRVHRHIAGTLPDGTAYRADDPALLTWVGAVEAYSFLAAYRRQVEPAMPAADQDRYIAEMARVTEALGGEDVPTDVAGLEAYLAAIRPALRFDHRTHDVAQVLLGQEAPSLALVPFRRLTIEAAIDLLPNWARRLHRLDRPRIGRAGARVGIAGVGGVMRWALRPDARG